MNMVQLLQCYVNYKGVPQAMVDAGTPCPHVFDMTNQTLQ